MNYYFIIILILGKLDFKYYFYYIVKRIYNPSNKKKFS